MVCGCECGRSVSSFGFSVLLSFPWRGGGWLVMLVSVHGIARSRTWLASLGLETAVCNGDGSAPHLERRHWHTEGRKVVSIPSSS